MNKKNIILSWILAALIVGTLVIPIFSQTPEENYYRFDEILAKLDDCVFR